MTTSKLNPEEIQKRFDEMRSSGDAARQELLQGFADKNKREAEALSRVRTRLRETLGPDDPRLGTLDRRISGTTRVSDFIATGGTETTPATPGDWVVMGRVLDADEKPIAGARVTLASDDQDLVRRFGESRTGADGRFEVRNPGKVFADIFKRESKARVVVTSPDGRLTHTTHEIQPAGDQVHAFDIRLRPEKAKEKPKKTIIKKLAGKGKKGAEE